MVEESPRRAARFDSNREGQPDMICSIFESIKSGLAACGPHEYFRVNGGGQKSTMYVVSAKGTRAYKMSEKDKKQKWEIGLMQMTQPQVAIYFNLGDGS